MALIYVVEDDKNISEIESFALKNAGHQIVECASGKEFHKQVIERIPDLILLDIMLPDEDGLQILTKMRATPETRRVPVILVTAKTTEIDKVKGLDMGAYIKSQGTSPPCGWNGRRKVYKNRPAFYR